MYVPVKHIDEYGRTVYSSEERALKIQWSLFLNSGIMTGVVRRRDGGFHLMYDPGILHD